MLNKSQGNFSVLTLLYHTLLSLFPCSLWALLSPFSTLLSLISPLSFISWWLWVITPLFSWLDLSFTVYLFLFPLHVVSHHFWSPELPRGSLTFSQAQLQILSALKRKIPILVYTHLRQSKCLCIWWSMAQSCLMFDFILKFRTSSLEIHFLSFRDIFWWKADLPPKPLPNIFLHLLLTRNFNDIYLTWPCILPVVLTTFLLVILSVLRVRRVPEAESSLFWMKMLAISQLRLTQNDRLLWRVWHQRTGVWRCLRNENEAKPSMVLLAIVRMVILS